MPRPKPPSPDAAEALAAINTRVAVDIAGLATNPMADLPAQNIANGIQQAEAQALAEAAAAIPAARHPAPPKNPPFER